MYISHDMLIRNDKAQVQGLVRIGTGRTRGMGKVEIDIQPRTHAEDAFDDIQTTPGIVQ